MESVDSSPMSEEEKLADIVGVKSVAELKQQWKINLNGQQLMHLPNAFNGLDCLLEVHLNSNQLAELPESLLHLAGLQVLAVGNNHLQRLPEVQQMSLKTNVF